MTETKQISQFLINSSKECSHDIFFLKVIVLLSAIGLLLQPTGNMGLFYLCKGFGLALLLKLIITHYSRLKHPHRFSLFVIIYLCIIAIVRNASSLTIEGFMGYLSFVIFCYSIVIASALPYTKSLRRFTYHTCLGTIIVLSYYAFYPLNYITPQLTIEDLEGGFITLGYYNTNYAGMIIFAVLALFFANAKFDTLISKVVNIGVILWCLYLIFLTNCRSALFAGLIMIGFTLLFKHIKYRKWVTICAISLPVLFVPFYITFSQNNRQSTTEIMGKSLTTGRDKVYLSALEKIDDPINFCLGAAPESGVPNAHNGPLSVLVALGILGAGAFGYILYSSLCYAGSSAVNTHQRIGIYIIIGCLFETCGEVLMFLGAFPTSFFMFFFFLIAFSYNRT